MRAAHTGILLLLLGLPFAACDTGPGSPPTADEVAPDFGPTAAYNRRLLFLGPGAELPTTAVFDFIALSDSIGIRRGVRARVLTDSAWRPLANAGWEMEPMREPWRLVPHGPLTMIVTETGDLGALVHRDTTTIRLRLGATLAEHSPDVGTQLVLREAQLVVGDRAVAGTLLDAQLGRAVNPDLVRRGPRSQAADSAAADTAGAGAAATSPTPIARPGTEALLLGDQGYSAVLATASGGNLAWIRHADQDDVRAGARLEPTAWSAAEQGVPQVPTSWRITSADGSLAGEIRALATDRIGLSDVAGLEALAYSLVDGWVEDRSVRREVFGLVRHVR